MPGTAPAVPGRGRVKSGFALEIPAEVWANAASDFGGTGQAMQMTIDEALAQGGAGSFQRRLLGIFGLVWAADAMQVIAIGFTAASIAASFGLTVPQAHFILVRVCSVLRHTAEFQTKRGQSLISVVRPK